MYSRNSVRTTRYSPPPGYTGNTFSNDGEVKHHLPNENIVPADPLAEKTPMEEPEKIPQKIEPAPKPNLHGLNELFESFVGRFGSEELIILAVMLLIAQDGIGVEVLILALALLVG